MNPNIAAFCGIDLHEISQARRPIYVEMDAHTLDHESILAGLRTGNFTLRSGNVAIPSTGELTFFQELSIAVKQPLRWLGDGR